MEPVVVLTGYKGNAEWQTAETESGTTARNVTSHSIGRWHQRAMQLRRRQTSLSVMSLKAPHRLLMHCTRSALNFRLAATASWLSGKAIRRLVAAVTWSLHKIRLHSDVSVASMLTSRWSGSVCSPRWRHRHANCMQGTPSCWSPHRKRAQYAVVRRRFDSRVGLATADLVILFRSLRDFIIAFLQFFFKQSK